ncbi:MAG: RluA family pseudouridine synthase [Phycisphaeraceae bacterium]|nr:RluA family pseudouridine synthase [Phycisphaeraceae bacterium]MCW5754303.1 RluA family pseudouridine synthase [Phycisphaeraceae bacterium]
MSSFSIEQNERVTYKVHHEDEHLLVVAKPARLVTQPGIGHDRGSLLNGLFARYGARLQNLGAARDFGLVHRLDAETSGLLAVALSIEAYEGLRRAFEQRVVRKFYWAIVWKRPKRTSGVVRLNLAEQVVSTGRYTQASAARVVRSGKPALTAYRVLGTSEVASVLECRPVTGRLHQIRVHMDAIGCPVLGDPLYGPRAARQASPRLALHAHRLAFAHPVSGEPLDVRTGFPRDLRATLRLMRLERPDLPATPTCDEAPEPTDDGDA